MRGRIGNQRGGGSIGCLFMIALIAGGMYAGLQFGLPQLRHNAFRDRLNETYSFFSRQSETWIRGRVIQIAEEFHIDLKPEQVKIQIRGDQLTLDITYEKVVDLKVWQKTLPFSIHRQGPF